MCKVRFFVFQVFFLFICFSGNVVSSTKKIFLSDFKIYGANFERGRYETVNINVSCSDNFGVLNNVGYQYQNVNGPGTYGARSNVFIICNANSNVHLRINSHALNNSNAIAVMPTDNPLFISDQIRCFSGNVAVYRFVLPQGNPTPDAYFNQGGVPCISSTSDPVPTSLPPCCVLGGRYYQTEFTVIDIDNGSQIQSVLMSLSNIGNLNILSNAAIYISLFGTPRGGVGISKLHSNLHDNTDCDPTSVANVVNCQNLVALCSPNGSFSISVTSIASSYSNYNLSCDEYVTNFSSSGSFNKPIYLQDSSGKPNRFDPLSNEISVTYTPYPLYRPLDPFCSTGASALTFQERPQCSILQDTKPVSYEILYDNIDGPGVDNARQSDLNNNYEVSGSYKTATITLGVLLGVSLLSNGILLYCLSDSGSSPSPALDYVPMQSRR